MLAFSLGMIISGILPPYLMAVVAAILLAVTSFVSSRRCRC